MSKSIYTKQPGDTIDIDIDASQWLPEGDTIQSASAVGDTGLTLGETSANTITKFVKQWVSGGTNGMTYKVTVTITSTNIPSRIKEVEFYIRVKEY